VTSAFWYTDGRVTMFVLDPSKIRTLVAERRRVWGDSSFRAAWEAVMLSRWGDVSMSLVVPAGFVVPEGVVVVDGKICDLPSFGYGLPYRSGLFLAGWLSARRVRFDVGEAEVVDG